MKKKILLSLMLCTLAVSFTACGDSRQTDRSMEEQSEETTIRSDSETEEETTLSINSEATEEISLAEEQLASPNKSLKELFDKSNSREKTESEEETASAQKESKKKDSSEKEASEKETSEKETSRKEKESLKEEESEETETASEQKDDRKETKKDKESDQEELSDDWTDLQFMMDGTVISVSCTYEDLNQLGWEFHKYYKDCDGKELPAQYSDVYQLVNEAYGDHIVMTVSAQNVSDERQPLAECPIYKISIETDYKAGELDEAPEIILPGGVSLGAESEEIMDAYGKYDSKFKNSKGGRAYTYRNRELDCEMTLEISEKTGLCSFKFWHYN